MIGSLDLPHCSVASFTMFSNLSTLFSDNSVFLTIERSLNTGTNRFTPNSVHFCKMNPILSPLTNAW